MKKKISKPRQSKMDSQAGILRLIKLPTESKPDKMTDQVEGWPVKAPKKKP